MQTVIVASLLHDVGHLVGLEAGDSMERMGHCGILDHEVQGGAFLRKLGLSPRVAKLVQCHVMAKRYLCYKDPEYYSKLSDASKVGSVGVIRIAMGTGLPIKSLPVIWKGSRFTLCILTSLAPSS